MFSVRVRPPLIQMSVHPFTRRFPLQTVPSLGALSQVREEFASWLGSMAPSERVGELEVVVSELGANAVHGTPAGSPPPTITAWLDDSVLTLEVTNHVGSGPDAHVDDWDLEDPLRTGGRGLLLVSAFVDDVDVDVEDDLLLVRCTAAL